MSPFKFAAFSTAALLATTALASAAVITQTESFGPSKTNWGTSGSSAANYVPNQAVDFVGFNPALGTLTGVKIQVTEDLSGTLTITNDAVSGTPSEVTGTITNIGEVGGLPGVPDAANGHGGTFNYQKTNTDAANFAADLGPGDSATSGTITASTFTTIDVTTDLSAYEAAWSAEVGQLGSASVTADNGDGTATYTDDGSDTIVVTYTYTPASSGPPPVPEPASLALLSSGLVGIGALRRRRRSR